MTRYATYICGAWWAYAFGYTQWCPPRGEL